MRFCLLALAVLGVADCLSLTKLETAVTRGKKAEASTMVNTQMFAYQGAGQMSMTVSKESHQLTDKEWAEMRTHRWHNVDDERSPLKKMGYSAWTPTANGVRFRNLNGNEVVCHTNEGDSLEHKKSTEVHFNCDFDGHRASLLEVQQGPSPGGHGGPGHSPPGGPGHAGPPGGPGHDGPAIGSDYAGYLDKSDYDDHQKGEMWVPAENGVPYGWNKLFQSFGFPYFTVTPKGFLGCYKLDHGMCAMTPTSFSTTGLQPAIKSPNGPPERWDMTPKFPQGSHHINYDDLRTKPWDVHQNGEKEPGQARGQPGPGPGH